MNSPILPEKTASSVSQGEFLEFTITVCPGCGNTVDGLFIYLKDCFGKIS